MINQHALQEMDTIKMKYRNFHFGNKGALRETYHFFHSEAHHISLGIGRQNHHQFCYKNRRLDMGWMRMDYLVNC